MGMEPSEEGGGRHVCPHSTAVYYPTLLTTYTEYNPTYCREMGGKKNGGRKGGREGDATKTQLHVHTQMAEQIL